MRPEIQHGHGRAQLVGHGVQGHLTADLVDAEGLLGDAHDLIFSFEMDSLMPL
jgi:hypothetical protein